MRRSGDVKIEWLALTRSGQSIYIAVHPPWSSERASLVVLYQNEILWITKFPAVSANDLDLRQYYRIDPLRTSWRFDAMSG